VNDFAVVGKISGNANAEADDAKAATNTTTAASTKPSKLNRFITKLP
jgi:hypothetical protein